MSRQAPAWYVPWLIGFAVGVMAVVGSLLAADALRRESRPTCHLPTCQHAVLSSADGDEWGAFIAPAASLDLPLDDYSPENDAAVRYEQWQRVRDPWDDEMRQGR